MFQGTQTNNNQPAQGGQPANPAPAPAPTQEQTAQTQAQTGNGEFVTKAEMEQKITEALRNAQSMTGKMEARINKKIVDLQAAGVNVTREQAQAIVTHEDQQAQGGQSGEVLTNQAAQPGNQPAPQQGDPVINQAISWMQEDGIDKPNGTTAESYRMMAEAGVHITENDPELKNIGGKTPIEFLKSVEKAIADKKAREERSGSPGRIPALAQGGQSGNAVPLNVPGKDVLDDYFKKFG
ncbi:MAG TPA: hypothetical protein DDW19_01290 [Anaerolineaceae bacterium]|jgi:hypothetical protein|nr:hypothetical protein [Anaerolineaceae bacterium]